MSRKPVVLVVEDEPLIAMALEDALRDLGCDVVGPISHGPDAIEALRTKDVDAAFVDLDMVGEHQYDLADALAEKKIPFGFATGTRHDDLPAAWQERPFMSKPFAQDRIHTFLLEILPADLIPRGSQRS